MSLLKHGGYTIMWRHAQTDRSVSDIPGQNTERYQQRNLNDAGVALAKSVGMIFKARAVPVGEVIASPMYRTMETAQYAFGHATKEPLLYTLDASPAERAVVLVQPAAGTNRVIVTHHFIIERNAPGIKPGDVGEGEAAIVKSDGKSLKTIAVIKLADWAHLVGDPTAPKPVIDTYPAPKFELTGVSPETAAKFHSGRGHVALSYVQSFNAGRDAMKAFFENLVVPNADRPIEARLESFTKLRTDLGGFDTITGANITDAEMTVDAKTTTGKAVRITFKQEKDAPFRATSINVQYYAPHGG
jgi:phosphohistidine phosphatase SixA